ncbi:hypothetical protein PS9374_04656 [Planomonospora sphaerica]|uniref:Uncharacterized protein n=1 Tax=Planomonospora sphaerica TaxID=161355 RepID=A0A171DJI3_9ACTN|nr:hypothetical protein PS9374_04656 [Planomonospora sphaerica]
MGPGVELGGARGDGLGVRGVGGVAVVGDHPPLLVTGRVEQLEAAVECAVLADDGRVPVVLGELGPRRDGVALVGAQHRAGRHRVRAGAEGDALAGLALATGGGAGQGGGVAAAGAVSQLAAGALLHLPGTDPFIRAGLGGGGCGQGADLVAGQGLVVGADLVEYAAEGVLVDAVELAAADEESAGGVPGAGVVGFGDEFAVLVQADLAGGGVVDAGQMGPGVELGGARGDGLGVRGVGGVAVVGDHPPLLVTGRVEQLEAAVECAVLADDGGVPVVLGELGPRRDGVALVGAKHRAGRHRVRAGAEGDALAGLALATGGGAGQGGGVAAAGAVSQLAAGALLHLPPAGLPADRGGTEIQVRGGVRGAGHRDQTAGLVEGRCALLAFSVDDLSGAPGAVVAVGGRRPAFSG